MATVGKWGHTNDPIGARLRQQSGGIVRLGVDIGQAHDPTALCVSEEERRDDGVHYVVRSIERMPLGTSYPAVASRISEVMDSLKHMSEQRRLDGGSGFRVELSIDSTGVGRPVIDLVRAKGLKPIAVTLTGGDNLTEKAGDTVSMAKSFLVSRLQVLLQSGRLHMPDSDEARILARELQDYRITVSDAGNASFNARSGKHDDLVIALGLSTGTGQKKPPGTVWVRPRGAPGQW